MSLIFILLAHLAFGLPSRLMDAKLLRPKDSASGCPDRCYTCTVYDGSDVCQYWCSSAGNCGTSDAHKQGGTDCTGCKPTPKTPTLMPTTSDWTPPPSVGGDSIDPKYLVLYIDYLVNWDDIVSDIKTVINNGFNVVMLSFYMDDGPWDIAKAWTWLTDEQRIECVEWVHAQGAKIMVSAGGATFNLEAQIASRSVQFCEDAAKWAIKYGLDGVDFDMEFDPGNSAPLKDGTGIDWLVKCNQAARTILGNARLISHAPQAPYLSTWAGNQLGYVEVYRQAQDIDFLNIQYYNQGGAYNSFETIFLKCQTFPGSAVLELATYIPKQKLVVGKPTKAEYAGTGYLSPDVLHNHGQDAFDQFGWFGGYMGWMYALNDAGVENWEHYLALPFINHARRQLDQEE